jgi:hypothetical protein
MACYAPTAKIIRTLTLHADFQKAKKEGGQNFCPLDGLISITHSGVAGDQHKNLAHRYEREVGLF